METALAALFSLVIMDSDPVKVTMDVSLLEADGCRVAFVVRASSKRPKKVTDRAGILIDNPVYTGVGKGTFVVALAKPSSLDEESVELVKRHPVQGVIPAVPPSEISRFAVEMFKEGLTSIPKLGMVFGFAGKLADFIQATSPQAKPDARFFSNPDFSTAAMAWQSDTTVVGGQLTDEVTIRFEADLRERLYGKGYLYFQTWEKVEGRLFGMKPWDMHFDLRPTATNPALAKLEAQCMAQEMTADEQADKAAPARGPVALGPAWTSDASLFAKEIPALDYLPSDLLAVAVVASPRRLVDTYEVKQLLRRYKGHEDLVYERKWMARSFGFDLWDLGAFARGGLDVKAPAGAALLDVETETWAYFAKIASRKRVIKAIRDSAKRSKRSLEDASAGGVTVLCRPRDETCFVIRGDAVILVFSDDGAEHARRFAGEIAERATEQSFLQSAETKEAREALAFGEDLALYVNPSALMEDYVKVRRYWAERYGREFRLQEEERLLRGLSGMMQWAVGGATLHKKGIRLRVLFAPEDDEPLARAFGGQPSSAFERALETAPDGFAVARLDLPTARLLWEDLLEVGGESVEPANHELRRELGLDLTGETLKHLSGLVGGAFTLRSPESIHTAKDAARSIGFSLIAGTRDEQATATLWHRFRLRERERRPRVARSEDGAYDISDPGIQDIRVVPAGAFLVASTAPSTGMRLASPGAGGPSWSAAGLDGVFLEPGLGLASLLDLGTIAHLFRPEMRRLPRETDRSVSFCREAPDLRRAAQLSKKVHKWDVAVAKAQRRSEGDLLAIAVRKLGWLGFALVTTDRGLEVLVEYSQGSSLSAVAQQALDVVVQGERAEDRAREAGRKGYRELHQLEDSCRGRH